jgi:hypothetical protein
MRRYGTHDDEWQRIRHLLPGQEGHVGLTAVDNRLTYPSINGLASLASSAFHSAALTKPFLGTTRITSVGIFSFL